MTEIKRRSGKERRGRKKEEWRSGVEKYRSDRGRADLRLIIRYNAHAAGRQTSLETIVLADSPSYSNIPN